MGRKFRKAAGKGRKHALEAKRAMEGAEHLARYSEERARDYVRRVRQRDRHFEGQTTLNIP